jgi:hypothetical protein
VSDYVYDSVLLHAGERVDLGAYRPVEVALKETRARAWTQAPANGTTTAVAAMSESAAPGSVAHLRVVEP